MNAPVMQSRLIPVTPELAFSFWTEPVHIRDWFTYDGTWVCEAAEVDLRTSGNYHLAMRSPGGQLFSVRGEFQIVEPPHRLSYTWSVEGEAIADTIVTVEFLSENNRTRLNLSHDQFINASAAANHGTGWQLVLEQFEQLLTEASKS